MGRKMESRKWLNMMEKSAGSTEAGNLDGPEDRKKKQKLSMKVDQSIPPVKTEPEPEGVVTPSYFPKPDRAPSPPPVNMSIIHGPADIALKYEDSSPGCPTSLWTSLALKSGL
jgi:hypothetical protein